MTFRVCAGLIGALLFTRYLFGQTIDYDPPAKSGNARLEHGLQKLTSAAALKPILPRAASSRLSFTADGKVIVILVPEPGEQPLSVDVGALEAVGGEVLAKSTRLIRAAIPPDALDQATQISGVNFIRAPYRPSQQRVVSEGTRLINAAASHTRGVRGQGAHVAIIDEGFKDVNLLPSDMPTEWWELDYTEEGMYSGHAHGTACAEIIHDIVPEAVLTLLKVGDLVDLENAKDLCVRDGVSVISHSLTWLGTGFGDGRGIACEIVDDARESGILWVNSAGNYVQRQYTALWADVDDDRFHNVESELELLYLLDTEVGDLIEVWLTWNDWPRSFQDYDLWLVLDTVDGVELLETSDTTQRGSEPVEHIEYEIMSPGSYALAVFKETDARAEVIKVFSENHDLSDFSALVGSIGSPADARGSLSVGAIFNRFWNRGTIEPYSSRGPTADGRIKPDLVAPTGVSTVSFGDEGFFGTSAAAPHVAGAAALIQSANPSYTRDELIAALVAAAQDLGDRGFDNVYGHGKLVLPELQAVSVPQIAALSSSTVRFRDVLTITGQNFGRARGAGRVVFYDGVDVVQYVGWSDTEISVRVPVGARTGQIVVVTEDGTSEGRTVIVSSPWIESLSRESAKSGQFIFIRGSNFGDESDGRLTLANSVVPTLSWSSTRIVFRVPPNARSGSIIVRTEQGNSNSIRLVITTPYIRIITPRVAEVGDEISIFGGNFERIRGNGSVRFGRVSASASDYVSWSNTRIVVKVPQGAESGDVMVVTVEGRSGGVELEIEVEQFLALPSQGVLGYSPPSVTGHPKEIAFEFPSIRRDLIVSVSLKEASTNEVSVSINDTELGVVPESTDWTFWYLYLVQTDQRSGRNILTFRNLLNQRRDSGFDTWQISNVQLWKPFNAKSLAASFISDNPPSSDGLGLGSKQVIKPAGLWLDESCSSSRHGIHVAPGGLGPFSRR